MDEKNDELRALAANDDTKQPFGSSLPNLQSRAHHGGHDNQYYDLYSEPLDVDIHRSSPRGYSHVNSHMVDFNNHEGPPPSANLPHKRFLPFLPRPNISTIDAEQPEYINDVDEPQQFTSDIINYDIRSHSRQIEQSKLLPPFMRTVLSAILGIKKDPKDRPILATILFAVTVILGLLYVCTFSWYTAMDIANMYTKSTLLTGLSKILLCVFWVAMGVYSHRISSRIFRQTNIIQSVRTRTKTIFKMNAAVILTLVGMTMVALLGYRRYPMYTGQSCSNVTNHVVCMIVFPMEMSYSIVALFWNMLMGFVILSVARTHTIGLRKFLRVLDKDAQLYHRYLMHTNSSQSRKMSDFIDDTDWYVVEEKGYGFSELTSDDFVQVNCDRLPHPCTSPPIMSNEDILSCYWKINCHLRSTSMAFQRWLASWISLIFLWCAENVLYWSEHDTTIISIASFLIPLLAIPLLTSAYAEANAEGTKIARTIYPLEERIPIIYLLTEQPLQMTVFNIPVTFRVILGTVAAVILAFLTKILLGELTD